MPDSGEAPHNMHMDTTMLVFKYVRNYVEVNCWSPTLREIADGCGLAWPSSVVRHLERLENWGMLLREPHQARSIVLTDKGREFPL